MECNYSSTVCAASQKKSRILEERTSLLFVFGMRADTETFNSLHLCKLSTFWETGIEKVFFGNPKRDEK